MGEGLLTKKRWKKDATGFWVDAQGNRIRLDMRTVLSLAGIGRMLTEQLRRQGVDASFGLPSDFSDPFNRGQCTGALYGQGESVRDAYDTLPLDQSASLALPGGHRGNFSRRKNAVFDTMLDDVYVTDMNNTATLPGYFRKAWRSGSPNYRVFQ